MKYPQQWCVDKTGSRNPDMKGAGLLVNRSAQRSLQPKPSSHAITGQGLESAPGNHQKSDSSEVPIAVADMSCEVISDVADMSFESKELVRIACICALYLQWALIRAEVPAFLFSFLLS